MKLVLSLSGFIWNSKIILKLIAVPSPHPSSENQGLDIKNFISERSHKNNFRMSKPEKQGFK